MIERIIFREPIPVAFGNERLQDFRAPDWDITVESDTRVRLRSIAGPEFIACGVAFSFVRSPEHPKAPLPAKGKR